MPQGRRPRRKSRVEYSQSKGRTREPAPAEASVLGRRSLTVADAQGVRRTGEIILAEEWHADLGAAPSEPAFRIVLVARHSQGDKPEVGSPAVAVCLPESSRRGPGAIREPPPAYLTQRTEPPADSLAALDVPSFSRGSILSAVTVPLRVEEVFPPAEAEPRLELLATALLAAAGEEARDRTGSSPLLRALASALAAPDPAPSGAPDTKQLRAGLRSLLAAAESTLAAAPAEGHGKRASQEALRRLSRLTADRRTQDTLFTARALYAGPMALAEDVYLARCLIDYPNSALVLASMRSYLTSAALPEARAELDTDRRMSLETASFATLFHAPHRLDDMRATFELFRERYRAAYAAHHRRYWLRAAALRRELRQAAPTAEALARLNTLRELGGPVGEESLRRYRASLSVTEACTVSEGLDALLADRTACPSCHVTLRDEPPEEDVREVVQGLTSALARQQTRLSSEAVHRILAAGRGERLERFLQVVQASDLSGLARVLDDDLLAFLRDLLAANLPPASLPVLERLRRAFPDAGEDDVESATEEFRRLLLEALAARRHADPGRPPRVPLD